MGISGHMLGDRKLRQLNAWSGFPFDRAYNRNGYGAARLMIGGNCWHYNIDFREKRVEVAPEGHGHWSSCRERMSS